jgi:hypothetical protein
VAAKTALAAKESAVRCTIGLLSPLATRLGPAHRLSSSKVQSRVFSNVPLNSPKAPRNAFRLIQSSPLPPHPNPAAPYTQSREPSPPFHLLHAHDMDPMRQSLVYRRHRAPELIHHWPYHPLSPLTPAIDAHPHSPDPVQKQQSDPAQKHQPKSKRGREVIPSNFDYNGDPQYSHFQSERLRSSFIQRSKHSPDPAQNQQSANWVQGAGTGHGEEPIIQDFIMNFDDGFDAPSLTTSSGMSSQSNRALPALIRIADTRAFPTYPLPGVYFVTINR